MGFSLEVGFKEASVIAVSEPVEEMENGVKRLYSGRRSTAKGGVRPQVEGRAQCRLTLPGERPSLGSES